jgi:hypothetical protein
MNPEQAVAYVNAQAIAARIELESMLALNEYRKDRQEAQAYGEEEFRKLQERYCIGHNDVIQLFQDSGG